MARIPTAAKLRTMLREHVRHWQRDEVSAWDALVAQSRTFEDADRSRLARQLDIALSVKRASVLPVDEVLMWQALDGLITSADLTKAAYATRLLEGFDEMLGGPGWPKNPAARANAVLLYLRLGGNLMSSTILRDEPLCRAAPRLALDALRQMEMSGELLGYLLSGFIRQGIAGRRTAVAMILPLWRQLGRDAGLDRRLRPGVMRVIADSFRDESDRVRYCDAVKNILGFDPREETVSKGSVWRRDIEVGLSGAGNGFAPLVGAVLSSRSPARIEITGGGNADTATAPHDIPILPITYNGLIDDVMFRYDPSKLTDAYFRGMIAKNVFFSDGVLLNDGYLMNHPIARAELLREESLLRNMLNQGFVRILARDDPEKALVETPEAMAAQGNLSFQNLIGSDEWLSFRKDLRSICGALSRKSLIRRWPNRNMSHGFTHLASRIFDKSPEDLGLVGRGPSIDPIISKMEIEDIGANFDRRDPRSGSPRDKFEKAAHDVLSSTRDVGSGAYTVAMRVIMEIANQCYHYNFGLALGTESDVPIAVDTTVGLAFEDILETKEIYEGVLSNFPLIELPPDLPLDDGRLFNQILDSASRIGAAKRQYIASLDKSLKAASRHTLDGDSVYLHNIIVELQEAGWEYMRRVGEHFGSTGNRRWYLEQERMRRDSPLIMAADEAGAVAAAGPTGLIVVRIMDMASKDHFDVTIDNFKLKRGTEAFEGEAGYRTLHFRDLRPRATSVAFADRMVDDYAKNTPLMEPTG